MDDVDTPRNMVVDTDAEAGEAPVVEDSPPRTWSSGKRKTVGTQTDISLSSTIRNVVWSPSTPDVMLKEEEQAALGLVANTAEAGINC